MTMESPVIIPSPDDATGSDVTIATAGHVDHGKSTLVRVLTGTNPDRLPEERRREMTIELGFASIARPDGGRLAFIDVPGHERLVETMVSGSGTVDAALLVVAADDGPMPQTIEHLRILGLLGIEEIVVAITRTDLVDEDWLDLAIASTRDLLNEHGIGNAPIVPVSAITGAGLDHLRNRLLAVSPRPTRTVDNEAVWLPIDRVFHRHGFGTIVAGTLSRGRLHHGDVVGIWPADLRCTVRQLQNHNEPIESASAGQRVAVNLAGIELGQVTRGNVLSDRPIPVTESVDIRFEPVTSMPKSGELVRVMIGTDRVDATIQLVPRTDALHSEGWLARLRFRRPTATVPGDRLIVRRPSPAATIGGGVVLARHASRPPRLDAGRRAELMALAAGDPEPTLWRRLNAGPISIASATADLPESAVESLHRWVRAGTTRPVAASPPGDEFLPGTSVVITEGAWLRFLRGLEDDLATHHAVAPETIGLPLSELRNRSGYTVSELDDLIGLAVREGCVVRRDGMVGLPGHRPRLHASEQPVASRLLREVNAQRPGQLTIVRDILPSTIDFLERTGAIVRIDDDRIMSADGFERVARWMIKTSQSQPLELPAVRHQLGLGRDTVQRLMERLDRMGLTVRHGERRRPGPAADQWMSTWTDRHARRTDFLHEPWAAVSSRPES